MRGSSFVVNKLYPGYENMFLEFKGANSNNKLKIKENDISRWNYENSFRDNCAKVILGFVNSSIICNYKDSNPKLFFGISDNRIMHGIYKRKIDLEGKPVQKWLIDEATTLKESLFKSLSSITTDLLPLKFLQKALIIETILLAPNEVSNPQDFHYLIKVKIEYD